MKVSKYMTKKIFTATPNTSVKDAFLLMKNEGVRHLPVLENGAMVGIISDRDLRRPKWAEEVDDWTSYYEINDETMVGDIMIKNPEVVYTYDKIRKSVKILREQGYGALPVLNKKGELVGMLSAYDLLGVLEDILNSSDNNSGK